MTPERRAEIEAMLAEPHTPYTRMTDLEAQAHDVVVELLAEIDRQKAAHAEWAVRATIYHEMLITALHASGVDLSQFDDDAIEREVSERIAQIHTAANNFASLTSSSG